MIKGPAVALPEFNKNKIVLKNELMDKFFKDIISKNIRFQGLKIIMPKTVKILENYCASSQKKRAAGAWEWG